MTDIMSSTSFYDVDLMMMNSSSINETSYAAVDALHHHTEQQQQQQQHHEGEESFTSRHVALAVIPHITGILSLLGSTYIVVDVIRVRFQSVYHRLVFGLATSDIIASSGLFLSTWPIPKATHYAPWGSVGSIPTCELQGFLIQMGGLATTLYSAFLSIYYVLLIQKNWRHNSQSMLLFEKIAHTTSTLLAMTTAIASLLLKLYNNANLFCWIAPYPMDCTNSITTSEGEQGTCLRGDNAWVYRMAFYFSWLWASAVVVTISMIIMVTTVYRQSKKMDRYQAHQAHPPEQAQQPYSRDSTCSTATARRSTISCNSAKYNCTNTYFPLSLTTVIFFPLQGLWNALIYARPQYLRYKARKEKERRKQQGRTSTSTSRVSSTTTGTSILGGAGSTGGGRLSSSMRTTFFLSYFANHYSSRRSSSIAQQRQQQQKRISGPTAPFDDSTRHHHHENDPASPTRSSSSCGDGDGVGNPTHSAKEEDGEETAIAVADPPTTTATTDPQQQQQEKHQHYYTYYRRNRLNNLMQEMEDSTTHQMYEEEEEEEEDYA